MKNSTLQEKAQKRARKENSIQALKEFIENCRFAWGRQHTCSIPVLAIYEWGDRSEQEIIDIHVNMASGYIIFCGSGHLRKCKVHCSFVPELQRYELRKDNCLVISGDSRKIGSYQLLLKELDEYQIPEGHDRVTKYWVRS
jgi:hypothetical protein